jgi:hypothetical protein
MRNVENRSKQNRRKDVEETTLLPTNRDEIGTRKVRDGIGMKKVRYGIEMRKARDETGTRKVRDGIGTRKA